MSAKRTLILAALTGLLLYNFIVVSPAAAQSGCQFSNPVHDGQLLEDSIISGMHAVGDGALPGLDGVGSIYPMFPGLLFAGTEPNPSGLVTTYIRIEGTGSCEGWVMDVFHLVFAQGLENKVGTVVDEDTLLGVESMNGVAPQFRAHWHVSVGYRGSRPQGYDSQMVSDAVSQVYWVNPLDLVGGAVGSRRAPKGSDWSGIVLIVGAVLLVGFVVLAILNPPAAWSVARATGRAGLGIIRAGFGLWYWIDVYAMGILRDERRKSRRLYLSATIAALLFVIPLACLASLSVILGGGQSHVQSVWLPSGPSGQISTIFTPEVQAWAPKIVEWSRTYDLDPNLVATIMQIESCGDASAVSPSGAQGLFQVMPFHFVSSEDMQDPDTNAIRGLSYLRQTIAAYPEDFGRAITAYNGGIAGVSRDPSQWEAETRKYWYWGTGIFADASSGATESARLAEWLAVDAGRLCKSTMQNKENAP